METEIDRCKELRRQNMRTYIENIRDEIFAQYEKCFYGREQMESFLPLYSSTYSFFFSCLFDELRLIR